MRAARGRFRSSSPPYRSPSRRHTRHWPSIPLPVPEGHPTLAQGFQPWGPAIPKHETARRDGRKTAPGVRMADPDSHLWCTRPVQSSLEHGPFRIPALPNVRNAFETLGCSHPSPPGRDKPVPVETRHPRSAPCPGGAPDTSPRFPTLGGSDPKPPTVPKGRPKNASMAQIG